MPWLTCTVEMHSRRAGEPVRGEFEGRSIFECAWAAVCTWCQLWYYDSQALVTVQHGDRVWHVRQDRLKAWRPLVLAQTARQRLAEAKERDPEGKQVPGPQGQ